jgi:ABC-2 type transport system ATP-binding protein
MTTSILRETQFIPRVGVPEPAISVRGLTKRFPRRRTWAQTLRHPLQHDDATVLHRIDCDVQRGEFFGLLGPNGAGKTTLFKILATLILPDEGSVHVEGHDVVTDGAGVRRVLAPVIADERSLHWRLSAYENLRLFAALQGVPPGILRRRVTELLAAVGLGDEGSKLVGAFSSGMKQRLLIARALIITPKVLTSPRES